MEQDWLPVDEIVPDLIQSLATRPSAVLRAPTGAGKTTRVGPALLDAGLAGAGRIILVEPRRLAARAAAARMAEQCGSPLGQRIGYHVRYDRRCGRDTRVLVVTEGVLLRRLLDDPFATDAEIVIFDEFHERRLDADLLLGMLRLVQQTVRPQLRLLVMSATFDVEPVAEYLAPCSLLRSEGRLYPVDIEYAPRLPHECWSAAIVRAAERIVTTMSGDVLVFVPGVREIRQAMARLEEHFAGQSIRMVPLYGDLPAEQQDVALRAGPQRRIIVATNVAETSVTVEGVTAVIDTGLARQQLFDPRVGLDRLELVPISQASADQRAGRAGRLQPGRCVRLWDAAAQRQRPLQTEPEIRRVDLAGALLHLKCWVEPNHETFPWYERPREDSVQQALAVLSRLGALHNDQITPLGQQMGNYPVHPRLARMMIEGQRWGAAERVALAAALLSERSPFAVGEASGARRRGPTRVSRSDVLDQVEALERFEQQRTTETDAGTLHRPAAHSVLRARDQLLRLMPKPTARAAQGSQAGTAHDHGEEGLLRALVAAFPDRVARRREPGSRKARMVGGRGVVLAPSSAVLESPLLLCVDVDAGGAESLVRLASEVEREWLPRASLTTDIDLEFDLASERVVARRRLRFEDLILEENPAPLPESEAVASVLAAAAHDHLERVLPGAETDAGKWLTRVQCLREWMPEQNLPDYTPDQLLAALEMLCHGRRSFAELRSAPWLAALQNVLTAPQRQLVEREAPERLTVPSGSRLAVQYERQRPPALAVRIQEIFGLRETPRIAGGRVRVVLHLLAPSHRPVQVTDDLTSFWQNTYPRIRQELRRKYPKHAWPEDPLAASAMRGPKRKDRPG